MSSLMGMEVDNDIDEDDGDEVQNANDLQMLERLRLGDDNDDNVGDEVDFFDNIDSDADDNEGDDDEGDYF